MAIETQYADFEGWTAQQYLEQPQLDIPDHKQKFLPEELPDDAVIEAARGTTWPDFQIPDSQLITP